LIKNDFINCFVIIKTTNDTDEIIGLDR
jgi:hypothetical protein